MAYTYWWIYTWPFYQDLIWWLAAWDKDVSGRLIYWANPSINKTWCDTFSDPNWSQNWKLWVR
jgi:hypothetical protein